MLCWKNIYDARVTYTHGWFSDGTINKGEIVDNNCDKGVDLYSRTLPSIQNYLRDI